MTTEFERVAIVNRGEPAMRFINAARELTAEGGRPVRTIALYSDPDRRAMFVREADERWSLGPATFTDADGRRKSAYLDYARLQRALLETRAEAVWVGWGFVAEHAEFADLCARLGVVFIGPDGDMMRKLGDKIESKRTAERAEVPVAPWSGGAVDTLQAAREHAERLGYPLMLKATAGGGGRGIRRVRKPAELAAAFESARSEALKAFGDETVFLEKLVTGAHHVEVQVLADAHGTTWALGVRDCTIQRRNQKVLEESPSPVLGEAGHAALQAAAVRLTGAIGYRNAGTVEFLYDPRDQSFSFMEVNARLQVEHPVTELITGVDLVKAQVAVARGEKLEGEPPPARGHAIEVRLTAEDTDRGFVPAPGTVTRLQLPVGPGIRVDTGIAEGDTIPSEFDSMVGKIIAHGRDRSEALARLRRALYETAVVIQGGASNKGFLLELLGRPEVRSSELDVGWLDRLIAEGAHRSARFAQIAVLQAALDAYDTEVAVEQLQFYHAAARGRPTVSDATHRRVELAYGGVDYELDVARLGVDRYRVTVDGAEIDLGIERYGDTHHLRIAGEEYRVRSVVQGLEQVVEVEGASHRISRERGGVVRAPSPAVVVSVLVQPGDTVEVGDRLLVLEAMKMEIAIEASFAGRVREVRVISNVQVEAGAPLVVIESSDDAVAAPTQARVDFSALANPASGWSRARTLAELRALLLGYDADARAVVRALAAGALEEDVGDAGWAVEDQLLSIFADISSLLRRRLVRGDDDEAARTPEDYFFTYLRDPRARQDDLPASFRDKLNRAVEHYGVGNLQTSPLTEAALFRLFKSHHRISEQCGAVLGLLQRRLDAARQGRVPATDDLQRLVTRVADCSAAVENAARELLYVLYERPLQEELTARAYADVEEALETLVEGPDPHTRAATMDRIVACPYPLASRLAGRFLDAVSPRRELMLEAIARRYYRICDLSDVEVLEVDGFVIFAASYPFRGNRNRALCLCTSEARLPEAVAVLRRVAVEAPADHDVVADIYVWRAKPSEAPDETEARLRRLLADADWERPIRRIVFSLSRGLHDSVEHYTYRRTDEGLIEERVYRGLHPMMSRRLQLWRMRNFEMERLPSAEDVYLFRVVARDNPKDERIIALAEVRDLTPVRRPGGELLAIPHLEHMLSLTLAELRASQADRPATARLYWNRVHLFVWPPLSLPPEEVNAVVRRLAPQTTGLGIERVLAYADIPDPATGRLAPKVLDLSNPGGGGLLVRYRKLPEEPIRSLSEYEQKVVRLRRRGLIYPYELLASLTPKPDDTSAEFPPGEFIEYDLDDDNALVPVHRAAGANSANVVVGVLRNVSEKYPEGITRVAIFGDPSKGMGSLAEPECRRVVGALDLAKEMRVPVEWFAVSAGAKISMDSGSENMDWIAAVLRRLIEFTQAGGEVNIIVCGVNVGAQPYWNAEATMLMHTRGILIMLPGGSMVLTGKQALDYSGGVSAEDNEGIGGYERIMGPNGQAQYQARDIRHACRILLQHYGHTYIAPGEHTPRRAATTDPVDRDVCDYPHGRGPGVDFATVGDVFSEAKNPGRKKPFEIRKVMKAAVDQDHAVLERWAGMRGAETAVVWDAHIGGYPVCLLGVESHPIRRLGFVPADGPASWTSGTLFPASSKKVARAINAASGNRPVVVLANLSGFDGSPDSMRNLQLEFGAEIGRAVVNFRGPMVFLVISRYHGGAFVVFSNKLNDNLEVAALEGTFASVIGGAPAAAVVFAREVERRTREDPRVVRLGRELARATGRERIEMDERLSALRRTVRAERMREVAEEFDGVHSVQRAKRVGSVESILPAARLRPYLVEAIARGLARTLKARDANQS